MVVMLSRCEDCVVRRACAWNAKATSNAHVYTLDRTFRCLIEDCAAWGLGRKQLLIYGGDRNQSEPYGADNVVRRFWCRWEGTRNLYHSENISFQYRASRGLLENVLCTYDAWESIEYPPDWTFSGFFYTDGGMEHVAGTRLLGCVGYTPRESNVLTPYLFLITGMDVLDVTLRDCLTYVAPARERGRPDHEVSGLVTNGRYYDSVRAEHLTVVGGAGIRLGARDRSLKPAHPVVQNALIMRTVDPEQTSQAAVVGGRYVDTVHFFDNAENFEPVTSLANLPGNMLSPRDIANGCKDLSQVNSTCRTARGVDPQLDTAARSLVRPYTSPHSARGPGWKRCRGQSVVSLHRRCAQRRQEWTSAAVSLALAHGAAHLAGHPGLSSAGPREPSRAGRRDQGRSDAGWRVASRRLRRRWGRGSP